MALTTLKLSTHTCPLRLCKGTPAHSLKACKLLSSWLEVRKSLGLILKILTKWFNSFVISCFILKLFPVVSCLIFYFLPLSIFYPFCSSPVFNQFIPLVYLSSLFPSLSVCLFSLIMPMCSCISHIHLPVVCWLLIHNSCAIPDFYFVFLVVLCTLLFCLVFVFYGFWFRNLSY